MACTPKSEINSLGLVSETYCPVSFLKRDAFPHNKNERKN